MPPRTKKKTAKKKTSRKKTTRRATIRKPAARKKTPTKKAAKRKPAKKKTTPRTRPWTPRTLMAELKKLGTAQNRKVYARHGAPKNMFGVSFANIYKLQKQIKRDHDLATALWKSGNPDAQTLAALIADPERATRAQLNDWVASASWFMTADYFAGFVARTQHALPLAGAWTKSSNEMTRRAGYSTLNALLKNGPPDGVVVETKLLAACLKTIEREIHDAPNRAREAMNTTVICIGVYHDPLHKQAVAAAKRIGRVEIDHGQGTHCKDFIAEHEIAKARAHRANKRT